jgi:hypothetical protein
VKIVGLVLDAWKLPVFKRHLDAAGYTYSQHPGLTADTWLLKVRCAWVHELQQVVVAANEECARAGKPA